MTGNGFVGFVQLMATTLPMSGAATAPNSIVTIAAVLGTEVAASLSTAGSLIRALASGVGVHLGKDSYHSRLVAGDVVAGMQRLMPADDASL